MKGLIIKKIVATAVIITFIVMAIAANWHWKKNGAYEKGYSSNSI